MKIDAKQIANLPSAGGGYSTSATVDFGTGATMARIDVAASWAAQAMIFSVAPDAARAEEALIEQLSAAVLAIDPGVGFTLAVHAPNRARGPFTFDILGV